MTETHVWVFVVGAIVINGLIYGGMSWVYFADKHRVDSTRGGSRHAELRISAGADQGVRELRDAA